MTNFSDCAWVVFIEPPPENSRPEQVLKYLARYLTGGPIADRRLIEHQAGEVTFWALRAAWPHRIPLPQSIPRQ